jgi:hypothetical protein
VRRSVLKKDGHFSDKPGKLYRNVIWKDSMHTESWSGDSFTVAKTIPPTALPTTTATTTIKTETKGSHSYHWVVHSLMAAETIIFNNHS